MISSEDGADTVRRAFDMGALDYISRPFDAQLVCRRIINTIRLYAKQRRLSAMVAAQMYETAWNSQRAPAMQQSLPELGDALETALHGLEKQV